MNEQLPATSAQERPPIVGDEAAAPQPTPSHLADPRALQILTTEHWSLLSQRSLAWTETFARAGMFLATLSTTTVALALVGSVMRDLFTTFALVTLPVVLFIGIATVARLQQSNIDDGLAVQGMNRIRHAYLEMVPELEPYFLTSHHDDLTGIMVSRGASPLIAGRIGMPTLASIVGNILHGFVTTMGMIMVICAMIGGVFLTLVAAALGAGTTVAVAAGFAGFVLLAAVQLVWGLRTFRRTSSQLDARFPTPPRPNFDR
jgi:hypothetical protein